MTKRRLSPAVIDQRMVEWHNQKKLLAAARQTITRLREDKKALKVKIASLRSEKPHLRLTKRF